MRWLIYAGVLVQIIYSTDETQKSVFSTLDRDGDGLIDKSEIATFVKETGRGNPQLDDLSEVQSASISSLSKLDISGDHKIDEAEFEEFAKVQSGRLATVDDTLLWAEHAMQLPMDVVDRFRDEGIIGADFIDLLANDGALLSDRLRISPVIRKRVRNGMRMMIFGMGSVPASPNMTSNVKGCGKILVSWSIPSQDENSDELQFKVHRAVLQRHATATTTVSSSLKKQRSAWDNIYIGSDTSYLDTGLASDIPVKYRLTMWNHIGRSNDVIIENQTLGDKDGCSSSSHPFFSGTGTRTGTGTSVGSDPISWSNWLLWSWLLPEWSATNLGAITGTTFAIVLISIIVYNTSQDDDGVGGRETGHENGDAMGPRQPSEHATEFNETKKNYFNRDHIKAIKQLIENAKGKGYLEKYCLFCGDKFRKVMGPKSHKCGKCISLNDASYFCGPCGKVICSSLTPSCPAVNKKMKDKWEEKACLCPFHDNTHDKKCAFCGSWVPLGSV
jgi:hypothetical protein